MRKIYLMCILLAYLDQVKPLIDEKEWYQQALEGNKKTITIRFNYERLDKDFQSFFIDFENFKINITYNDIILDKIKNNLEIEKSILKKVPTSLIHFNASEFNLWISCAAFKPYFIKVGYGYVMENNTLAIFQPKSSSDLTNFEKFLTKANKVSFDQKIKLKSKPRIKNEVLVKDVPPILIRMDEFDFKLIEGNYPTPDDLSFAGKKLYSKVAGNGIKLTDEQIEAINFSLDNQNCLLNKIIARKTSFPGGRTSYIRVTFNHKFGTSPGHPFVFEIWPKGHTSPIHNHGNTVAIIKVLHGTIFSEFFNPLVESSYENYRTQPYHSAYVEKGNVTWLTADFYQTHRLTNRRNDTATITLQSYSYEDYDQTYQETFDYILPNKDDKIHRFYPNSDIVFNEMMEQVEKEYKLGKCEHLNVNNSDPSPSPSPSIKPMFQPILAYAKLFGESTKGMVYFEQKEYDSPIRIYGEISNISKGLHGFHIHELGDLSEGCSSTGPHFNPLSKLHGGPNHKERHAGDLGNIEANEQGIAKFEFYDNLIKLNGDISIIGRSVVVHAEPDDLGLGLNIFSRTTGNAGGRIACGVIQLQQENAVEWVGNTASECDFVGNDLKHVKSKASDCETLCSQTIRCTHFLWTDFNKGTCWMKYGDVSKKDAINFNDPSSFCGIIGNRGNRIKWIDGNNVRWALGCGFSGKCIFNIKTTSKECALKCAQTPKCTHFTWTNFEDGICWMKSGEIRPDDAFESNDPTTLCGYLTDSRKFLNPLNEFLQHHWSFDSNLVDAISGNTLISSKIIDLEYTNDRLNKKSSAIKLAKDIYLEAPPDIYFKKEYTISVWINFSSYNFGWSSILNFGNGEGNNSVYLGFGLFSSLNSNNIPSFSTCMMSLAPCHVLKAPSKLSPNEWHHLALSVYQTQAIMYINGVKVNEGVIALTNPVMRSKNYIGSDFLVKLKKYHKIKKYTYNGVLDELKIFNKSLSTEEILELFENKEEAPLIVDYSIEVIINNLGTNLALCSTKYGKVFTKHTTNTNEIVWKKIASNKTGWFYLANKSTNKYLNYLQAEDKIIADSANYSDNQLWKIDEDGFIYTKLSTQVLDTNTFGEVFLDLQDNNKFQKWALISLVN